MSHMWRVSAYLLCSAPKSLTNELTVESRIFLFTPSLGAVASASPTILLLLIWMGATIWFCPSAEGIFEPRTDYLPQFLPKCSCSTFQDWQLLQISSVEVCFRVISQRALVVNDRVYLTHTQGAAVFPITKHEFSAGRRVYSRAGQRATQKRGPTGYAKSRADGLHNRAGHLIQGRAVFKRQWL